MVVSKTCKEMSKIATIKPIPYASILLSGFAVHATVSPSMIPFIKLKTDQSATNHIGEN